MARVAVVTLVQGRGAHLEAQHASLARSSRRPDDYVVVAMNDPTVVPARVGGLSRRVLDQPTTALGLPLAAARNRGVGAAFAAGADVVVVLDVDCLAGEELVAAYEAIVHRAPGTVWSGPVTYLDPPHEGAYDLTSLSVLDNPHPARPAPAPGAVVLDADPRLFWSLSFAVSRSAWRRSGGFCEQYIGYGAEDTDFGFQARVRGMRFGWVGSARAYHQFHPVQDPPVDHLDDILRNAALFHSRWEEWPMTGWLMEFDRRGLIVGGPDGWVRARTDA
jgi:N-acetylglucosaminyl-diphospho-decaprenol L-rhamnosyltransferase